MSSLKGIHSVLSFLPFPSYLCIPDVHAFVEGATGQVPAVGAERHAVDRLLVFSQRVDADAPLHVPETDRGVKGCTVGEGGGDRQGLWGIRTSLLEQETHFRSRS